MVIQEGLEDRSGHLGHVRSAYSVFQDGTSLMYQHVSGVPIIRSWHVRRFYSPLSLGFKITSIMIETR